MIIKLVKARQRGVVGYNVWTNQYTGYFTLTGFISMGNLEDMKRYFIMQGYEVLIIDNPITMKNYPDHSELSNANLAMH